MQSEGNGGLGLFAIADDLTGALEIGAKFAAHDLGATVVTELDVRLDSSCFALIVDLETRHVAAEEAVARTKQVANLAHDSAVRLFYLKTDSTLRGNIAAEFRAIEQIFPERRIVYVPAYPDMGRTVRNGQLFVHGKLVHETEFANDRWSPVRDCRIRNVLGDVQAVILDGECNRDIELAARGIMEGPPPQVCAGPAALAGALAKRIGAKTKPRITCPAVSRCLVVNGSLHPTSLQQMAFAEKSGFFDENWKALDETVAGSGSERAFRTGECVRRTLRSARFDALIVFGGDTAFGIHRSLGSEPFQAIGEIAPGVAVSRSSNLLWITKAGGFGPPDILARIRKRLT